MSKKKSASEIVHEEDPQNKTFSFIVGIFIALAIIIVFVLFFNH